MHLTPGAGSKEKVSGLVRTTSFKNLEDLAQQSQILLEPLKISEEKTVMIAPQIIEKIPMKPMKPLELISSSQESTPTQMQVLNQPGTSRSQPPSLDLKYFGLGVQNKKPTKPVIIEQKTVELPKEIKEAVKEKPEALELSKENVTKKFGERTVDEVSEKTLKILRKIPGKVVVSSSEIATKTHGKIRTPSKKTPGKKVKKRAADKTMIEKLSQNADLVLAKLQEKSRDDTEKPQTVDTSKEKLPRKLQKF